ncbi:MAG: FAD-linked oxidase C-terminal domain-containing protein [Pseudomonadota bacterium]
MTDGLAAATLAELAAAVGADGLRVDPADRWAYSYDNSRRQRLPGAVVVPSSEEQVQAVVRICRAHGVALCARGLGTGTAGAAVPPEGGLVISTERMTALRIDAPNRVAVVQPGATNGEVQRAAAEHGFFWPPDPTSANYSTVGGNLACNAAGPKAVKYGTPRENALGLRAVAGTGELLTTGCYTTKGVVGYDLTRLIIGSEGTLAVITEATLKLTPLPGEVRVLRLLFNSVVGAAAAVTRLMGQPVVPRAVEFADSSALRLIRDYASVELPDNARAMLMVEAEGGADIDANVAALIDAAQGEGLVEARAARSAEEGAELWRARKALSPALRTIAPKKINEDVVVPVSEMASFIGQMETLSAKYGFPIVCFGHAGNGNIHVNLLIDPDDEAQMAGAEACLAEVFDAVLKRRGTLSGEHGIGYDKREFVGLELDPVALGLMRAIKRQFDPDGVLNPGKLFPTDTAGQTDTTGAQS